MPAIKLRPEDASKATDCITEIEQESLRLLEISEKNRTEMNEYYPHLLEDSVYKNAQEQAASLKRASANITKALASVFNVSDELNARLKDIKNQKKKKKFISSPPSNATIDLKETEAGHFAKGLNIYKLLLICFTGSFLGVVIEMLWCLLQNGYIESRAGLVYGPFNLLYGVGAVALTAILYKFRNRGAWISFFGGLLAGSAVEYICSWAQELAFGSRSWDYSHMPFNINGRICLLYSIFWGILGVLWIKNIYPRTAKLILKLPERTGKATVWILSVFFAVNSLVTVVATYRWAERNNGEDPSGSFEKFIDSRFPDERMEKIFANMEFNLRTRQEENNSCLKF